MNSNKRISNVLRKAERAFEDLEDVETELRRALISLQRTVDEASELVEDADDTNFSECLEVYTELVRDAANFEQVANTFNRAAGPAKGHIEWLRDLTE